MNNQSKSETPEPGTALQNSDNERSIARLKTIMESEPECVKTVNCKGELIDLNPAGLRMLGATDVEQVRGTHLSMMVDAKDWPMYQENMEAVFQGETLQWQFRCNSPCGAQRWMEQTAGPVRGDADSDVVTEMVAITRDITDKKHDEGQLLTAKENAERASAAKTNFLANMSHEIRTPMNGILGMVNMLTDTTLTLEQEKCVSVIQQSSESLLRILNDILDLSKVEAGRIDLEKNAFRIGEQMQELQSLHSANASKKGLALEIKGCEHMEAERFGDPIRVIQILNNLLDNAIKFTAQGSVTGKFQCNKCYAGREGQPEDEPARVHFVVTDTGIGMTKEQSNRVFAPFSQADATTTRRYGGTGLGLTIAKSLTELMQGTLEVESELGKGARFDVGLTLPLLDITHDSALKASKNDASTADIENNSPPIRILAVEDGEVNRLVLTHILKKLNAKVAMVHDGKQAIEAFKQGNFDLILMDIHMPVMDGITATAEIRSIEKQQGIQETPIAAVTASVTDAEVDRYKTFGFSHCIAKPTEPARIREVIDSIRV
ncbi:ATP-binding protein [Rubripirellula sp.]|nr:ATP-binding protein [Rubripirellula sp.]MDB4654326.1 ATP-binding protein [Rubripirellula sp.]